MYSLIGGPCRDKALVYCTSDDLDWSQELGFKCFKVSNPAHYDEGIDGINLVEEHIAKARDAVGPNAELMYNPVMSFNVEFRDQASGTSATVRVTLARRATDSDGPRRAHRAA